MATTELSTIAGQRVPASRQPEAMKGFRPLLRKEFGHWWGTRRWLIHLLLWPFLLNGFVLLAVIALAEEPAFTATEIAAQVTTFFFLIGAHVTALGAVAATQSGVVSEKQRGTAAWVLSKPVSRSAFLLAKLLASGATLLTLSVLLPCAIFYAQSWILWGAPPEFLPFAASVLITGVHTSLYLALTLLLGTVWQSSGPVSGIAIGMLLAGAMAPEQLEKLTRVLPWKLPAIAGILATNVVMREWAVPVIATICWTALFVVIALWFFRREEF